MKRSDIIFILGRILSDMVAILGALNLAYFLRMKWYSFTNPFNNEVIELFSAPITFFPYENFISSFSLKFTVIIIIIFAIHGRYRFKEDEKILDEVLHIFWAFSAGIAILLVYFFFARFEFFSRLILGMTWIFSLIFILGGRIFLRIIRRYLYQKDIGKVKLLILGSGKLSEELLPELLKTPRFEIIGILSDTQNPKSTFLDQPVLGSFNDFEKILTRHKPQEILLIDSKSSEKISDQLIRIAHKHHSTFRFFPDELGLDLAAVQVSTLYNTPLISLFNTKIDGWGLMFKNGLDFIGAIIALILLSPILLVIGVLVWWQDKKAPIFYASTRVGKNGEHFPCYKFRTMNPNADKQKSDLLKQNERQGGILFKMDNDPRITPLGKFLRKYSLDEFPQLLNILKGDMSFIGPRPHLPEEVAKYPDDMIQILSIKPGLGGFAQINGRSNLSFEQEMNFELFYMKNWNIWLDFIIFAKSFLIMIRGQNK